MASSIAPVAISASPPLALDSPLSIDSLEFVDAVAAIQAQQSESQLLRVAQHCWVRECRVRTPLMLLQLLALARQYECQHSFPSVHKHLVGYGRDLEAHVWSFYRRKKCYQWRAHVAWYLLQLQHQPEQAEALQQLLVAMSSIHIASLRIVFPRLALSNRPLLLTRVLQQIGARDLNCATVGEMMKNFNAKHIKSHPPDTIEGVEAMVIECMQLKPKAVRPAAAAATEAMTDSAATAVASRHKRKRRRSSGTDDVKTGEGGDEQQQPQLSTTTTDQHSKHSSSPSSAIPPSSPLQVEAQPMEIDSHPTSSSDPEAAPSRDLHIPTSPADPISESEQKQLDEATTNSLEDLRKKPLVFATPEKRQAYAQQLQQLLDADHLKIRKVPGNGDCLLAATVLGCQAIQVDLSQELGLKKVHASSLRTYMAGWIRDHKQQLFDISGGDESWRGDFAPAKRRRRKDQPQASPERLSLDGCLDLFADTTERRWDIPWASVDKEAGPTSLGDYIPQLLAVALNIRMRLIRPDGPPTIIGERDAKGNLHADLRRTITLVQNIHQDHWDPALPEPSSAPSSAPSSPTPSTRATSAAATPSTIDADSTFTEPSDGIQVSALRRRLFADPSEDSNMMDSESVTQEQLFRSHASELAEKENQYKAALEEHTQQLEAIRRERDAALAVNRILQVAHQLEFEQLDHIERVRQGASQSLDTVQGLLQELVGLQATPGLYTPPDYCVTSAMVEDWKSDVEMLEARLGGPLREISAPITQYDARAICDRLASWLPHLREEEEEGGLSQMAVLLLGKKLLCIEQLLPALDTTQPAPPYPQIELHALLCRIMAHPRIWSYTFRLPLHMLGKEQSRIKYVRRSATHYLDAAHLAMPNVAEHARLLVEQCKTLEDEQLLHKAKDLNKVKLKYPSAPFVVLEELQTQYPDFGPRIDRALMRQWDREQQEWRANLTEAESQLSALEQDEDELESDALAQAREKVATLEASQPRNFEQVTKKLLTFFHPDKRREDRGTSAEEKSNQFGRLKDALETLQACRTHFEQLRVYQAQVASHNQRTA